MDGLPSLPTPVDVDAAILMSHIDAANAAAAFQMPFAAQAQAAAAAMQMSAYNGIANGMGNVDFNSSMRNMLLPGMMGGGLPGLYHPSASPPAAAAAVPAAAAPKKKSAPPRPPQPPTGDGTPARKKAARAVDENGNPVPRKARKKTADPGGAPLDPTVPVVKRKRKRDGEDGATEDDPTGGSGGKKKAARRKAAAEATPYTAMTANVSGAAQPAAAAAMIGKVRGPFHKEITDLLISNGDSSLPLVESASVLEDILLDFMTALTSSMLSVPSINVSKDAIAAAATFANSRDASGVIATHIATAPQIEMDQMVFILRHHPAYQEKAKEIILAAEQAAQANKK